MGPTKGTQRLAGPLGGERARAVGTRAGYAAELHRLPPPGNHFMGRSEEGKVFVKFLIVRLKLMLWLQMVILDAL